MHHTRRTVWTENAAHQKAAALISLTFNSLMLLIVFAVIVFVVTFVVFGVMLISALVLLGVHVFAASFTAKRARDIPLYWIVAVFSALGLCLVVMFAWHPIVVPAPADASASDSLLSISGLGQAFAFWRVWANAWPTLAGVAGAIVSVGMSFSSRPLVRALAGLTWGAAAMTLFSWIYNPMV